MILIPQQGYLASVALATGARLEGVCPCCNPDIGSQPHCRVGTYPVLPQPAMDCLIVIPARLKATRLPDKPLADIAGEPMIVHVWRRAVEAKCGPVVVVADDEAICEAVRLAGGEALITRPDHVSGSDRIFEAVSRLDPEGEIATIVNLQGDLPTLDPK